MAMAIWALFDRYRVDVFVFAVAMLFGAELHHASARRTARRIVYLAGVVYLHDLVHILYQQYQPVWRAVWLDQRDYDFDALDVYDRNYPVFGLWVESDFDET